MLARKNAVKSQLKRSHLSSFMVIRAESINAKWWATLLRLTANDMDDHKNRFSFDNFLRVYVDSSIKGDRIEKWLDCDETGRRWHHRIKRAAFSTYLILKNSKLALYHIAIWCLSSSVVNYFLLQHFLGCATGCILYSFRFEEGRYVSNYVASYIAIFSLWSLFSVCTAADGKKGKLILSGYSIVALWAQQLFFSSVVHRQTTRKTVQQQWRISNFHRVAVFSSWHRVWVERARKAHKIDISSFSAFGSDLDDWKLISRMHIKTEKICKSLFSFFVISREIEKWWTENSFWRLFHPHSNISSRLLSSFFCEAEKCRCRARGISFHFIYSSCYHSHRKIYNFLIS